MPPAAAHPSGHRASPAGARRRIVRIAHVAAAAAALLAAAIGVAHLWLDAPSTRARLRAEVRRSLRDRLGEAHVSGDLQIDWLGRLTFGPVEVPASRPGLRPAVSVERVTVRPRWLALLRGRAEPAVISLSGVRVEAGRRGEEARALMERMAQRRRSPARKGPSAEPPEIRFRDLAVVVGPRERTLTIGPLAGQVEVRPGAEESLRAEIRLPGGGRARLVRGAAGLRAEVDLAPRDLPEPVRTLLPFEISGGAVSALLEAGPAAGSAGEARFEVRARGLWLRGERLASEPVGPLDLALSGALRWDAQSRRLALGEAELSLGERGRLRLPVGGEASLGPEPRFSFEVRADHLDYAAALLALPPQLAPAEDAPHLDGPLSARLALSGPLHRPAEWRIAADLDIAGLRRAARSADPIFLSGAFAYRPAAAEGHPAREMAVGPSNPSFVPIAELPPHVARAVTMSEDAGFFAHCGFDFEELRNALTAGAESGRARGASTITQQLAKNLFLSRERTIARKVREAFLTVALEASLPKARLLEIYLNIAEWGPGVYGIGEAARHWFGKDARALTPREAAFLASIIPSPIRYHGWYYARGEASETFRGRVDGLLLKMREAGQLSDDQLLEALGQPIVFARGQDAALPAAHGG